LTLQMTSNLGTTAWCAPELLTSTAKARYTVKVDVYSYGMVLWELWERKRPYEELYSRFDIIDAVRAGRRPPIGADCPAAYRSLIQRCWHDQPARRPTFAYIVRYLKDELAHIKRQRVTSVSGHAISSPLHQILAEDRVVSPSQDLEDPKVIEKDKKTSNWNFLSPMTALANLALSQGESEKKYARDTDTIISAPGPPRSPPYGQNQQAYAMDDTATTTRSTFSYMPRQGRGHLPSAPLTIPQKPTQENLDDLASSPWASADLSGEVGPTEEEQPQQQQQQFPNRASSAWRDKYVLKFSGWNQTKPDTGLPPSLAPRPLSSSIAPPIPQEKPRERNESESQDGSTGSDDTSHKYSSFVDARGADGEPLPAEASVELDTYSSSNSVLESNEPGPH
jgi:serine/threonine protein kinase